MITFNLSVDFELGWGDLNRAARDDVFYGHVVGGLEQCQSVIDMLERDGIPSTWGVVGGCCYASLEELREAAPRPFDVVAEQLETLIRHRRAHSEVLFGRGIVEAISRSSLIDLGSHGFLHLVPAGLQIGILQEDVCASVRVLRDVAGRNVTSFIPPQNYYWPDDAFAHSGIEYVRHTPRVLGYPYSDPRTPAKFARLWNDLIRPSHHVDSGGQSSRLFFLRLDRGTRLWNVQLRMIRQLITAGSGSVFCFTHPHNLSSNLLVRRFADLCELIGESRDRGKLTFRKFCRELLPESAG